MHTWNLQLLVQKRKKRVSCSRLVSMAIMMLSRRSHLHESEWRTGKTPREKRKVERRRVQERRRELGPPPSKVLHEVAERRKKCVK